MDTKGGNQMYLGDSIKVFVRREPGGDHLFETINSSIEDNQEMLRIVSEGVADRLGDPEKYRDCTLEGTERLHKEALKLEIEIRDLILLNSGKYISEHIAYSVPEALEVQRYRLHIINTLILNYAKLYYIAKNYRGRELTLTELNAWIEEAGRS